MSPHSMPHAAAGVTPTATAQEATRWTTPAVGAAGWSAELTWSHATLVQEHSQTAVRAVPINLSDVSR